MEKTITILIAIAVWMTAITPVSVVAGAAVKTIDISDLITQQHIDEFLNNGSTKVQKYNITIEVYTRNATVTFPKGYYEVIVKNANDYDVNVRFYVAGRILDNEKIEKFLQEHPEIQVTYNYDEKNDYWEITILLGKYTETTIRACKVGWSYGRLAITIREKWQKYSKWYDHNALQLENTTNQSSFTIVIDKNKSYFVILKSPKGYYYSCSTNPFKGEYYTKRGSVMIVENNYLETKILEKDKSRVHQTYVSIKLGWGDWRHWLDGWMSKIKIFGGD